MLTYSAYAGWHVDAFKEGLNKLVSKAHGRNVRKRLCSTDVLVIDEISMVGRTVVAKLTTKLISLGGARHLGAS